jgi:stage IV sporulation protein B
VQGGEVLKKALKKLTASAVTLGLLFTAVLGTADYFTPDSYTVVEGTSPTWGSGAFSLLKNGPVQASASTGDTYPKTYSAQLMLYNTIPIKTVTVNVVDSNSVVLCGMPFGIKMFTNGVVVVGMADVKTSVGTMNPASEAGLKTGDIILSINGTTMNTNLEVEKAIENSNGQPLKFTINRDGKKIFSHRSAGPFRIGRAI